MTRYSRIEVARGALGALVGIAVAGATGGRSLWLEAGEATAYPGGYTRARAQRRHSRMPSDSGSRCSGRGRRGRRSLGGN